MSDFGKQEASGQHRRGGNLLGRLDALLPCIFIAQGGASASDMRREPDDTEAGLFAIGARVERFNPVGVFPHEGVLLPLKLCRDENMRAALLEIAALLDDPQKTMTALRPLVQAKLDSAFGGGLQLADRETFDGFFALDYSPELFRRLHESFDYVTEVIDDPAGVVQISRSTPFAWRSLGELMEWYHLLRGADHWGRWSPLTPFVVCGDTVPLDFFGIDRWGQSRLTKPAEDPGKWFVIRPGLADARIGIRLEMGEYGWAGLHLSLNDTTHRIYLSDVVDSFPALLAWGREIAEGDLPVGMVFDEEGKETVLTVLRTDDLARVLLRAEDRYEQQIWQEGIVSRAELATALRAELVRFFNEEFDATFWGSQGEAEDEDTYKKRILSNPWLAACKGT